ncbi:unnamed protein product [Closterium sp. NIES-65]|nr:unnamed protein product [Closterium sp. NIES-65]
MNSEASQSKPEKPGEVGNSFGEVDMSAPIYQDDLDRAGGFGTRDAIGTPFPEAVDATDFEEAVGEPVDAETQPAGPHTGIGYDDDQVEAAIGQAPNDLSYQTLNDYFVPASGQTQGDAISK